MPAILRSRVALLALMGVFLIPVAMSSLRGLTHILTCQERSKQPFTIIIDKNGEATVISATGRITRGGAGGNELCGGLTLDTQARSSGPGVITLVTSITNNTKFGWRGTASINIAGQKIPIDIGTIEPRQTRSDSVDFHLDPGTLQVDGSLLIGP
ncbi:MAG TPA: hypothetical protein VFK89_12030 [Actinomycetota bacterium]|nr:hypothetical protein [Actinomycetota bacterium]